MTKEKWHQRLSVQLLVLLTLAILPLGLIAIAQTNRVAQEADRSAGLALLGLTERAATAERVLIERAVGAARLMGTIAPELQNDSARCFSVLSNFVNGNSEFSFVGVLPLSGLVTCSSADAPLDLSQTERFEETMSAQQPTIIVNESAPASRESVFVVSEPFFDAGQFGGFVSVSIPHRTLPDPEDHLEELGLIDLITFNENGAVLTSRQGIDLVAMELPESRALEDLSTRRAQVFRDQNGAGQTRKYSIVTIEGSPAAVMAIWDVDGRSVADTRSLVAPSLFPVLMWIASLGVAMLAIRTLVLRHLSSLRRRMERFAEDRTVFDFSHDAVTMPIEIERLENGFQEMSEQLLRDEAELEDALRQQGVLVKEIHHRVKNNLQLISSIMNIQIRNADHEETRTVLSRLQDRVISLATIHRDLYQSPVGGRVDSGALVREIIDNSSEMVEVEELDLEIGADVDRVLLFPDQAVPLSLLVAEAMTNAMKYVGALQGGEPEVSVSLKQDGQHCQFKMTNSVGPAPNATSSGMGQELMKSFALRLGGQITTEKSDSQYTLQVDFQIMQFEPEARDY